ncbi:MAG: P-loop NTPase [bacterium]
MTGTKQAMQIWPIGSGKGGVGKTLLTANLGILLAGLNRKVVLLDADLGASNLHTALGIPYITRTLNNFLTGTAQGLPDTALETPIPGLSLIGGGRQLPAYPDYQEQMVRRILSGIPLLQADILLMDLGGGIQTSVLDLFLLSDRPVVVMTGDPASIQNTYHLLKTAVYRKILKTFPNNPLISFMVQSATHPKSRQRVHSVQELIDKISHVDRHYADLIRKTLQNFSPQLIVNMAGHHDDHRSADMVGAVCRKFLGIKPGLLGTMEYSPEIKKSARNLRPFTLDPVNLKATEQLGLIARQLTGETGTGIPSTAGKEEKPARPVEEVSPAGKDQESWLMNNIEYKNRPLYVLTEKLNLDQSIQTSVYYRGRILFSKKMRYPELSIPAPDQKALEKIISRQHLTALKGIREGRLRFKDEK